MQTDLRERILITGADGFVGRHLVSAMASRVEDQIVITAGGPRSTSCDWAVELTDPQAVDRLIKDVKPTSVVHLAAISAVGSSISDPRMAWAVNVGGTLNLLISIEHHVRPAHFIYVSSAEVYGATLVSRSIIDETAPLQPLNPYAASKVAAEAFVGQAARSGAKVTIVRPFNHTGAGQSPSFVIPAFAKQIAAIEAGAQPPVIKVGNLEAQRDFTDVRDIVAGYIAVIEKADQIESGSVFNFASGRSHSIGDLLNKLLALSSVEVEITEDPSRYRPTHTGRVIGDAEKARAVLGWQAEISIEDTLKAALNFFRLGSAAALES